MTNAKPPQAPPAWVKALVSLAVIFQFYAIGAVVTSASSPGFAAPALCEQAHRSVRPYVASLFMTNPYRFFAPDPGPTNLLWIRLVYANQEIRWVELPRREDFTLAMPYQRHLSIMVHLQSFFEFVPAEAPDPGAAVEALLTNTPTLVPSLTPMGRIVFSSFARHVANTPHYARLDGQPDGPALEHMDFHFVLHHIRTPAQIQVNFGPNDPRLYEIFLVGNFQPNGVRNDKGPEYMLRIRLDDHFVRTIHGDFADFLEKHPNFKVASDRDLEQALTTFGMPYPYRKLYFTDRELTKSSLTIPEVTAKFGNAVTAHDDKKAEARILGQNRPLGAHGALEIPPSSPKGGPAAPPPRLGAPQTPDRPASK